MSEALLETSIDGQVGVLASNRIRKKQGLKAALAWRDGRLV